MQWKSYTRTFGQTPFLGLVSGCLKRAPWSMTLLVRELQSMCRLYLKKVFQRTR